MHGSRRYHTPCCASGIVFGREHFQLLLRPQPGLPRRRLLHVHVHDFLHAGPIVESASPSLARQSHMRNLQKQSLPTHKSFPLFADLTPRNKLNNKKSSDSPAEERKTRLLLLRLSPAAKLVHQPAPGFALSLALVVVCWRRL